MFDVNTAIGHWPFRRLERNTPEALKNYLKPFGVTRAAVAHNHAACYLNVQDANVELAAALATEHEAFFLGVATLNPTYAAWEKDLRCCVEQLGFRALRLLPQYHHYRLAGPEAAEILQAAGEMRLPVVIPNELVNYRQRSWMEPGEPLGTPALLDTAKRFPNTTFLFMETAFPPNPPESYPGNAYFELSRFHCCYGRALDRFVELVGADHVLFGSGAPFKEIEPALLKLHHLQVTDEKRAMIENNNAERLFGDKGL